MIQALLSFDSLISECNLIFKEPTFSRHLTHEELTVALTKMVAAHSDIARLYSVGKSVLGRDLWVIEISDNPGVHEPGERNFTQNDSVNL